MAKKSTTDSCCLTLPLVTEKWQSDRLEKRFEIARTLYNTLLHYELKKLDRLKESPEYSQVSSDIKRQYESETKDEKALKALFKKRSELLTRAGFTEYSVKSDIIRFYKHFGDNIGSSVAVHGIAPQVWAALEKMLFGSGKEVHFKQRGGIRSVRGYSAAGKSGGVEIIFRQTYVEWKALKLPVKLDAGNAYETEMLQKRVKYCRILKKDDKKKTHWYIQLVLEGKPAEKKDPLTGRSLHPVGKGAVGIDIGPQTIAYSSGTEVILTELADQVQNTEREKRRLLRKMDRSRRACNPDNYQDDGTVKKGVRLTRNQSKRYQKTRRELACLLARQTEIRKRQHNELANHLMSLGDTFFVEDMAWPSLTRRAQKTEISEKTGRCKRKKRFGKSVGNKAPAMLIEMLHRKLLSHGAAGVVRIPTSVRASQFNHITGEYVKKPLSQRWNTMPDGKLLQRDLYSAFLLQHMNDTLNGFDQKTLALDYENFVQKHDAMIRLLQAGPKTISSMGIANLKQS